MDAIEEDYQLRVKKYAELGNTTRTIKPFARGVLVNGDVYVWAENPLMHDTFLDKRGLDSSDVVAFYVSKDETNQFHSNISDVSTTSNNPSEKLRSNQNYCRMMGIACLKIATPY